MSGQKMVDHDFQRRLIKLTAGQYVFVGFWRCGFAAKVILVWRELIISLSEGAQFGEPATWAQIDAAGDALGDRLPSSLRVLLKECNGVTDHRAGCVVWTVDSIVETNREMRTSERHGGGQPFDTLLFFADAGNGDQFAIMNRPWGEEIVRWHHGNGARWRFAGNMDLYLRLRLSPGPGRQLRSGPP